MTEKKNFCAQSAPAAKETAIYEAVLALLSDGRQFYELTISEIAVKAGIGKGTVYEYFDSKETLFGRTLLYCMQAEQDRAEQLLRAAPDFQSAVFAMFELISETLKNPLSSFRLLFAGQGPGGALPPPVIACADGTYQLRTSRQIALLLDMGRAEGLVGADTDNETGFLALKGAVAAFVAPCPQGKGPDHRDRVYRLLLKMLA